MSLTLDDLKAKVTKNTDAVKSAIALLQGLSAKLSAIANDPAAIQALADELDSDSTSLAEAVVANTPSEA